MHKFLATFLFICSWEEGKSCDVKSSSSRGGKKNLFILIHWLGLDPKLLGVRGKKCPLPAFPVGGIRCFVYFVLSPHLSLHMIRFVNTFPPSFHRFFQHPLGFCRFQLELFQSLGVKKRVERKKEKTFFFSKESFQIWLERQRCVPTEVYLKEKKTVPSACRKADRSIWSLIIWVSAGDGRYYRAHLISLVFPCRQLTWEK